MTTAAPVVKAAQTKPSRGWLRSFPPPPLPAPTVVGSLSSSRTSRSRSTVGSG